MLSGDMVTRARPTRRSSSGSQRTSSGSQRSSSSRPMKTGGGVLYTRGSFIEDVVATLENKGHAKAEAQAAASARLSLIDSSPETSMRPLATPNRPSTRDPRWAQLTWIEQ